MLKSTHYHEHPLITIVDVTPAKSCWDTAGKMSVAISVEFGDDDILAAKVATLAKAYGQKEVKLFKHINGTEEIVYNPKAAFAYRFHRELSQKDRVIEIVAKLEIRILYAQ